MATATVSAKRIKQMKKSAEGIRGVYLDVTKVRLGSNRPFKARLGYNNQVFSLGYYENPTEGAIAYNKKAKSIFRTQKAAMARGFWNNLVD